MAEAAKKLPVQNESKTAPRGEITPVRSLRREIDRLFDQFNMPAFDFPFGRSLASLEESWPATRNWMVAPAMDLVEKDGKFEISAELPGLDEKNVEVKLANGLLTIKGEKSEEKDEKDKEYHLSERRYGSFSRSFRVPEGVDAERIEASFNKGILTVVLPKNAKAQKQEKKIHVKAA